MELGRLGITWSCNARANVNYETLKTMRDRGVRRMPVVDASGDLAGIIAFDDVMQHVGTTLSDIAQVIGTERVVEGWRRN